MIILVSSRVDVKRQGEFAVAFESRALVVALQRLIEVTRTVLGGIALCFLLDALALACHKDLVLACFVFFA